MIICIYKACPVTLDAHHGTELQLTEFVQDTKVSLAQDTKPASHTITPRASQSVSKYQSQQTILLFSVFFF